MKKWSKKDMDRYLNEYCYRIKERHQTVDGNFACEKAERVIWRGE